MMLDKQALDRHITGNWGEDQFKDSLCMRELRTGMCQLDYGHRGRCTTVAFYCDACGKMRRGSQPYRVQVDANGDADVAFCFMCVEVDDS